jgi:hypothetical protein
MNPTKKTNAPGTYRAWPAVTGLSMGVALGAMLSTTALADM